MLARLVFTLIVMTVVVWLLLDGLPLGAIAVVALAVWLRRSAEAGRFALLR